MNKKLFVLAMFLFLAMASTNLLQSASHHAAALPVVPIKTVTVHGEVANEFGHPLPGITVEVRYAGSSTPKVATTDANGVYTVDMTTELPQTFIISVNVPGYQFFNGTIDNVDTTDLLADVELKLAAGFMAEGIVLDHETGFPIQDAVVTVWPEDPEIINGKLVLEPVGQAMTNEYGYFSIHGSQRYPLSEHYGLDVNKSGYASYSTILFPPYDDVDYTFKEIKLASATTGYRVIQGQVKSKSPSGEVRDLEYARIKVLSGSTRQLLTEVTTDARGYFYIPMVARPNDYFVVQAIADFHSMKEITLPGSAGTEYSVIILEYDPVQAEASNWFDVLFSKLKEVAWQQLTTFINDHLSIGTTVSWQKSFTFGFKGMEVTISLDVDLIYSDSYEVTIKVIAGPFDYREGSYVRASIPGTIFGVTGRLGATFRLQDPDHDLSTFNPVIYMDHFEVGKAVGIYYEFDFNEWLESKLSGDNDQKGKLQQLAEKLGRLKDSQDSSKPFDFSAELKAEIQVELGRRLEINGQLTVFDGNDAQDKWFNGLKIDNIKFYQYFHISAQLQASASVKLKVYIAKLFKWTIASGTLSVDARAEFNFYPWQGTYYFMENRLQIDVGRFQYPSPQVVAKVDWSALGGLFSGTKNLVNWHGSAHDSGWFWSTSISFASFAQSNYAPLAPTLSGSPTNVISGQTATFVATTTDPDLDDIQYEISWGDGTSTVSSWLSSGSSFTISHSWSSVGTFDVRARAYDGTDYGYWSNVVTVTVDPASPGQPSIGGPSSVVVGFSNTFTASAHDPQGANVRFTFYWGDGSSWTSGWVSSGSTVSASHVYTTTGTKYLVVTVENSYGLTNDATKSVKVTNNNPATPSTPSGSTTGYVNLIYTFLTATTDSDGHKVRYEFDWGDGTTYTTGYYASGIQVQASHSWSSAGTYYVKVRAQDQYGAWSGWSSVLVVSIYNAVPSVPSVSVTSTVTVGKSVTFSAVATDPTNSLLQYTFYWGDGSSWTSGWVSSGSTVSASHVYTTTGTKNFFVTVKNSYGNTRDSPLKSIKVINNAPNQPNVPSGPSSGTEDTVISFSFYAKDPDGHKIRYQIDWGDGTTTTTGYYPSGVTISRSHVWNYGAPSGLKYTVKVRVQDQYGLWSPWSYGHDIIIKSNGGRGGGPIIMSVPPSMTSTVTTATMLNMTP